MKISNLVLATVMAGTAAAVEKPDPMILHSAYTPFGPLPKQELNVTGIPKLAKRAKFLGVNTIFVSGSMSEFDTMTVTERETLISAWLEAAQKEDLYTIVNVGTTVQSEAKQLARFADKKGADAIATVPPYYSHCSDVDTLVTWLGEVASAAPDLPLWYYHIPGTTQVNFNMADLMPAAESAGLSQLTEKGGIKFVSSDTYDFFQVSNWVADGRDATILFAPEPKLQGFALQTPYAGAVLAEDFYAPTYLRMRKHYDAGDAEAAIKEQNWKYSVDAVFSKYGGTPAKRASYRKTCGVEMGDGRLPVLPFNESNYDAMVEELEALGFWDQEPPSM